MRAQTIGRWLLGALLCGVCVGCAGDLKDPGRFALNACEDPTAFVAATCGTAGCHVSPDAGNLLGTIDLASPGAAARLVDQATAMCPDEGFLVDSTDRTQSLLLDKLTATPKCGESMPFLRPPLSATDKACVAKFVDQMITAM